MLHAAWPLFSTASTPHAVVRSLAPASPALRITSLFDESFGAPWLRDLLGSGGVLFPNGNFTDVILNGGGAAVRDLTSDYTLDGVDGNY